MSHDDSIRHLAGKFKGPDRHANFGPLLEAVSIAGFRGLKQLDLHFSSPVTALSGLNGTGKSTIAQLTVCAYRVPAGSGGRHYVKDFFPVSVVDPLPFAADARVVYDYAAPKEATQQVTVSRAVKEWSGYKRQPDRLSYYVGLTHFLPKIEKRDFSVYGGARLTLGDSVPISDEAKKSLSWVLGLNYEDADFTEVALGQRSMTLAMVERNHQRYSENHMGFGEGRMFYIVDLLETTPERSLFVFEEPETSLHGDAQVRFAQYLIEVANRRRHQIVVTTHSSAILSQLPRASVVYLRKQADGVVTATTGLSTYQVDSYLHEHSSSTKVTICVEDAFAETMVCEVLRAADPDLLSGLAFLHAGSSDSVKKAVGLLDRAGVRSVGITDTDMQDDGSNMVMSLPGSLAPEREVFEAESVRDHFAASPYNLDVSQRLAGISDHHDYASSIADALATPEAVVVTEATRAYVAGTPAGHFDHVIDFVRANLGDRR